MKMTAEQIRDAAMEWWNDHRAGCTTKPCYEPVNFMAFIAHCLGIRATDAKKLADAIGEYEKRCQGCVHLRN